MKFSKKIVQRTKNNIQFDITELFRELNRYRISLQRLSSLFNSIVKDQNETVQILLTRLEEELESLKWKNKQASETREWLMKKCKCLDKKRIAKLSCFLAILLVLGFFILMLCAPITKVDPDKGLDELLDEIFDGSAAIEDSEEVSYILLICYIILIALFATAFYCARILEHQEDTLDLSLRFYKLTKELLKSVPSVPSGAAIHAAGEVVLILAALKDQWENQQKQLITEGELKSEPIEEKFALTREKELRREELTSEDIKTGKLGLYYWVIKLQNALISQKRFPEGRLLYKELLNNPHQLKKYYDVDSTFVFSRDLIVLCIVFFSWLKKEKNKNAVLIEIMNKDYEKEKNSKEKIFCYFRKPQRNKIKIDEIKDEEETKVFLNNDSLSESKQGYILG